MTPPAPFNSPEALRQAFAEGLRAMLQRHDDLGVYILVLANAAFEPDLWQALEHGLDERHDQLAALLTTALRQGRALSEPEDDLMVFLKLLAIGFENLSCTEQRREGPWEVQFNPLRALRPSRASATRIKGLRLPFKSGGFHFNKPFLAREILWEGELLGHRASLLYNKYPFATLHGLLVPERARQLPQYLTPEWHDYAWRLTQTLGTHLPGFGLAYNSLGAYASVNHLHFQSFLRTEPLPLLAGHWRHNGGEEPYPTPCQAFTEPQAAWHFLNELHHWERAYNLLYLPGRLFVLPRRHQGEYELAPWIGGHAWYEMAGGVTTFSREDFEQLTEADIQGELARLALAS